MAKTLSAAKTSAERAAERRAQLSPGDCKACFGKRSALPGKTKCQECADAASKYAFERKLRMIAQGRCRDCLDRPPRPGMAQCQQCMDASLERSFLIGQSKKKKAKKAASAPKKVAAAAPKKAAKKKRVLAVKGIFTKSKSKVKKGKKRSMLPIVEVVG